MSKELKATGLYDIDGKEIYEGDTVQGLYVTPFGKLTDQLDESQEGVITWEFGAFVLRQGKRWTVLQDFCKREEGEYISNYGSEIILRSMTTLKIIKSVVRGEQIK